MKERKRKPEGEARKVQVLEAAIRVLARDGARGLTHRSVAAEAGTSLRATTYYFASREALLTEALTHYAENAIRRFERVRLEPPAEGADPLDTAADLLAATVLSDLEDDRTGLVAEYELVLEIGRHPELEGPYRSFQAALERMLGAYAVLLGSDSPERDARLVLATLRGLELEALARPSAPPSRDELRQTFRTLLEGRFGTRATR